MDNRGGKENNQKGISDKDYRTLVPGVGKGWGSSNDFWSVNWESGDGFYLVSLFYYYAHTSPPPPPPPPSIPLSKLALSSLIAETKACVCFLDGSTGSYNKSHSAGTCDCATVGGDDGNNDVSVP